MPTKQVEKRRYRAPALEKGLDILEALAESQQPLSQSELAGKLGRSQTEFFRMLTCLEERGYIKRESVSGPYRLTLRLYELGHKQNATSLLRNAALLPMEKLVAETGQACHLSVPCGPSVLILLERMPSRRICLAVGEGTTFPLIETTSGRLLLSQLSPEAIESFLASDPVVQKQSLSERKADVISINRMGKSGFVLSQSSMTEGVQDAAVIVGVRGTDTLGALVIPFLRGPKHEAASALYLDAARQCAAAINSNLGVSR